MNINNHKTMGNVTVSKRDQNLKKKPELFNNKPFWDNLEFFLNISTVAAAGASSLALTELKLLNFLLYTNIKKPPPIPML